ncbi:DELLA protein RGL1-like [Daucus carota subsp. sativus]|nr:PREDICTED: DELLA protein RGL1-like [Daucus carota subsp. sativus]
MSGYIGISSSNIVQTGDNRPVEVLKEENFSRAVEVSVSRLEEPGEPSIDKGKIAEVGFGDLVSPSLGPRVDSPAVKQRPGFGSASLFELLSRYERGGKRLSDHENLGNPSCESSSRQKLSTEEIIRVAAERYIEFPSKDLDCVTTFIHPYGSALSSLSLEETSGADLAHLLLSAAEKIWDGKIDSARRMLAFCQCKASRSGNPIERLTSYFSAALQERISRETGSRRISTISDNARTPNFNGLFTGVDQTAVAIHEYIPFSKVLHFASTQTILEHVENETDIHLIDLHIRSGMQWPPMIQALSERKDYPIKYLKITALDTVDKQIVEDIGKRLESFANPLNISFSFNVVSVDDISNLNKELFDVQSGEAVVIYAPTILRTMLPRPDKMENLMRVIKELNPLIMILHEIEANDNSPSFINRFVETLFFYSTWFDCLEECLDRDNQHRKTLERHYFGRGIINTLATEGEERITRSVKLDVWRSYFVRCQMVEVEVPESSFHQAEVVLKKGFSCARFCTLSSDGKCLMIAWKGTPVFSLSTWKFEQNS